MPVPPQHNRTMGSIELDKYDLRPQERLKIQEMLSIVGNNLTLEALWMLMDMKWDQYQCNNKKYDPKKYSEFYQDTVWILNGLFIEEDSLSQKIRGRIASTVVNLRPKKILDWGGGLGSLARRIAELDHNILIEIYEPFPSYLAIQMCSPYENIKFTDFPAVNQYDLIVCTDVLEHITDPLIVINQISKYLKKNAYVIFANCFYPVVKCHLPSTFYLRYAFSLVCQSKGLTLIEYSKESYSYLYAKKGAIAPSAIQSLIVILGKLNFPLLHLIDLVINKLKVFARYILKRKPF